MKAKKINRKFCSQIQKKSVEQDFSKLTHTIKMVISYIPDSSQFLAENEGSERVDFIQNLQMIENILKKCDRYTKKLR